MAPPAMLAGVLPAPPSHFETPRGDPVRYSVEIISPSHNDWSLRQLADPNSSFREGLGITLSGLRASDPLVAYAPTVAAMSARILPPEAFTEAIPLTPGAVLRRPPADVGCDGLPVPDGQRLVMSVGGCALLVLTGQLGNRSACIAAHAGLDSVIDPHRLHGTGQPRPHGSVLEAMVEMADMAETLLTLRVFFTLPWQGLPRSSRDEAFGEKNARLLTHLADFYASDVVRYDTDGIEYVDLARLIECQAYQLGIGAIEVSPEYQLPVNGRFAYTTNERPGLGGAARNLVILTRR